MINRLVGHFRRRFGRIPMPEMNEDFVRFVRDVVDPIALPQGFTFNSASVGVGSGPAALAACAGARQAGANTVRETTVLYETS